MRHLFNLFAAIMLCFALTAIAAPSVAIAGHTLDIVVEDSTTVYQGELLGVDQVGAWGYVKFRADSVLGSPPPSIGKVLNHPPAGDFKVVVEGEATYSNEGCRLVYFTYMASNTHYRLEC